LGIDRLGMRAELRLDTCAQFNKAEANLVDRASPESRTVACNLLYGRRENFGGVLETLHLIRQIGRGSQHFHRTLLDGCESC
jgi:hypothetical protein